MTGGVDLVRQRHARRQSRIVGEMSAWAAVPVCQCARALHCGGTTRERPPRRNLVGGTGQWQAGGEAAGGQGCMSLRDGGRTYCAQVQEQGCEEPEQMRRGAAMGKGADGRMGGWAPGPMQQKRVGQAGAPAMSCCGRCTGQSRPRRSQVPSVAVLEGDVELDAPQRHSIDIVHSAQ